MKAAYSNSPTFLRRWRSVTRRNCGSISHALYCQIVVVSVQVALMLCVYALYRDYWTSSGSQSSAGPNSVPAYRITKYSSRIRCFNSYCSAFSPSLHTHTHMEPPSFSKARTWIMKRLRDLYQILWHNRVFSGRLWRIFRDINLPTFLILNDILLEHSTIYSYPVPVIFFCYGKSDFHPVTVSNFLPFWSAVSSYPAASSH